jgi:hypothetical protein
VTGMGTGPAYLFALAEYQGQLHVSGQFGPGNAAGILKRWTGSAWVDVPGTGLGGAFMSLAVFQNSMCVGGRFDSMDIGYTNNISRWDGAAWNALGGFNLSVRALCQFDGDLVAAGEFRFAGGVPAYRIARSDGSTWSAIGAPPTAIIYATAQLGNDLIAGAGSSTGIYRWNGATWSRMGTLGGPKRLPVIGGQLYAIPLNSASNFPNAVMRWNGSDWESVGSGVTAAYSVVDYNQNLIASGTFPGLGNAIARWNGIAWVAFAAPFIGAPRELLVADGQLYASWRVNSNADAAVARWDGAAWTQLGGLFDPTIDRLAASSGVIYAGGQFTTVAGVPCSRVAQWTGTAWAPLGTGLDGPVYDMLDLNGTLAIGGYFTQAGGQRVGFLAYWNCPPTPCYANCDSSTVAPVLNVLDFNCFLNRFGTGDAYANCDGSSTPPVLNVLDFNCFLNAFGAGCP